MQYRILMIAPTSFFSDYGGHIRILEEARILRQALASPAVRAPKGLADRIVAAAAKMKGDTAEPRTEGETAES